MEAYVLDGDSRSHLEEVSVRDKGELSLDGLEHLDGAGETCAKRGGVGGGGRRQKCRRHSASKAKTGQCDPPRQDKGEAGNKIFGLSPRHMDA